MVLVVVEELDRRRRGRGGEFVVAGWSVIVINPDSLLSTP